MDNINKKHQARTLYGAALYIWMLCQKVKVLVQVNTECKCQKRIAVAIP